MNRPSVGLLATATRRAVVSVGVISLVSIPSIGASASSGRAASQTYIRSEVVWVQGPGGTGGGLGLSCTGRCLYASFGLNEHRVRIVMVDATGLPVYGLVRGATTDRGFCGSIVLDETTAGQNFSVEAVAGMTTFSPCGEATKGTMVATFSG